MLQDDQDDTVSACDMAVGSVWEQKGLGQMPHLGPTVSFAGPSAKGRWTSCLRQLLRITGCQVEAWSYQSVPFSSHEVGGGDGGGGGGSYNMNLQISSALF